MAFILIEYNETKVGNNDNLTYIINQLKKNTDKVHIIV